MKSSGFDSKQLLPEINHRKQKRGAGGVVMEEIV